MPTLIHFKEGVKPDGVKLVIWDALFWVAFALQKFNYALVVTSLNDSVHSDGSLHPRGYAADIRSRDMRPQDVPTVVRELSLVLGKPYQVIQELDHIHVEYDPDHNGGLTLP